uniref:Uncharacterized protein n=1 Tax=Anguilla anguilla TaxID=7936 RepID=A0A0E9P7W0_ANGAN
MGMCPLRLPVCTCREDWTSDLTRCRGYDLLLISKLKNK